MERATYSHTPVSNTMVQCQRTTTHVTIPGDISAQCYKKQPSSAVSFDWFPGFLKRKVVVEEVIAPRQARIKSRLCLQK